MSSLPPLLYNQENKIKNKKKNRKSEMKVSEVLISAVNQGVFSLTFHNYYINPDILVIMLKSIREYPPEKTTQT